MGFPKKLFGAAYRAILRPRAAFMFLIAMFGAGFAASLAHAITPPRKILLVVEDSWGRIAGQLADQALWDVRVLLPKGVDPHDVASTPAMARELGHADIVLLNGAGYDDWALRFVPERAGRKGAQIIKASDFARVSDHGPNDSHYFLNSQVVERTADALEGAMTASAGKSVEMSARYADFERDLGAVNGVMGHLAAWNAAHPDHRTIAMAEPAGEALLMGAGYRVLERDLSYAVMTGGGVSPKEQAALVDAMTAHKVAFLTINPAHAASETDYLARTAERADVPVLPISETAPPSGNWHAWIVGILAQAARYSGGRA